MSSTTPVSVRFPKRVAERLRRRSATTGDATAGLVVRLVDEGLRMEDHPGVVFRDGPTGRRAGLVKGPDVWEIIVVLKDFASAGAAASVKKTATWLGVTPAQVRVAEGYYAAFPDEIEDRIRSNEAAAADAEFAADVRRRTFG